jgi:hypothetical protein
MVRTSATPQAPRRPLVDEEDSHCNDCHRHHNRLARNQRRRSVGVRTRLPHSVFKRQSYKWVCIPFSTRPRAAELYPEQQVTPEYDRNAAQLQGTGDVRHDLRRLAVSNYSGERLPAATSSLPVIGPAPPLVPNYPATTTPPATASSDRFYTDVPLSELAGLAAAHLRLRMADDEVLRKMGEHFQLGRLREEFDSKRRSPFAKPGQPSSVNRLL